MKKGICIKSIMLCLLLLVPTENFAQVVSFEELNTYVQKVRIGLVDEFFDRFNGTTLHPDIPATKKDCRKNNLMMLYNLSMFKSKEDPYFKGASDMMNTVIKDSVKLHFSDTTWVALAHCKGTMDGKIVSFDLYLTVKHRKQNMYKWVISRAEGKLFDIAPHNTSEKIMLMPDDHETNFLSLKRITAEQPYNVSLFMAEGFDYEQTSVFAYLVHSGKLKINYVDDLEFVFTQIPGYIFHIRYFDREKNNAGWLISKFHKATNESKSVFMKRIHPRTEIKIDRSKMTKSPFSSSKDSLNVQDSVTKYSKNLFLVHRNMRLSQISDYLCFMQNDEQRALCYYIDKFKAMFVGDAKVIVSWKDSTSRESMSVDDFCNLVINMKNKVVQIDSVSIPIWDDTLLAIPQSIDRCPLAAYLWTGFTKKKLTDMELTNYEQNLYAYREDTEDGVEWIPMFGDLMVTIK